MIYYLAVIFALVLLGVFALRRRLSFLEKIRKKRLSNVKSKDLLSSHINNNINEAELKQQRLKNLKKRFSITRRALYLAFIFIALLVAVAPLIGKFSPTLISVVVACLSVVLGIAGSWLLFTGLVGAWLTAVFIIPKIKSIDSEQKFFTYPDCINKFY